MRYFKIGPEHIISTLYLKPYIHSFQVIDGHIVTVNETSIKDDDTDLVLHVKVIDVRPTEGADASEESSEAVETTTPKKSSNGAESSEEHLGNEIPKQVGEDSNMP